MEKEATAVLRAEGFPRRRQRHERSLAMRYRGQSFELEVKKTTGDLAAAFHRAHRERYGYAQEHSEIEIVSARLAIVWAGREAWPNERSQLRVDAAKQNRTAK